MSSVRGWQMWIDWGGGGGLTGPLEDVTNYVDRNPITAGWGRPVDDLSQDSPASEMTFSLINRNRTADRFFSPENALSPIYGKVQPGKSVLLTKRVRGALQLASESWSSSTAGVNGWTSISGGTVSRVASPSEDGNGSLQYVAPGAVATVGAAPSARVSIANEPAGTISLTFRVLSNTTWSDVRASIDWYDVTNTLITATLGTAISVTAGVWTTITTDLAAPPALTTQIRPRLRIGGTPPNTLQINVDSYSVTSVPTDADKSYRVHAGVLDDFGVDALAPARTFSGKAIDVAGRPQNALSTPVYSGIRTGTAIGYVLDAIGWTGGRALDPGATLISYWWEEGTDPSEAILKLVNSEGPPAIAYVEGGTFVFRDRHSRIRSTASQVSRGIFSQIVPAGSGPGTDFKVEKGTFTYDYGLKTIANSVSFSVELRRPALKQEVWSQTDPISMNAGEVQTITAEPSDPVIGVDTPDSATAGMDVQSGSFTATIDRTSGQRITITLTCTGTGTLNKLALIGTPLPVTRTVQVKSTDPGSIARFESENAWPNEAPWANQYDAQAIADKIIATYADYRPRVTFSLVNYNDRYASMMLSLRIGDRITVRNDVLGLNTDFHVEQLTHSVERLALHRLTVGCVVVEPGQPAVPLTFGVAGQGFDQGSFAVAGIDNPNTMFIFDQAGQGFGQGVFAT